MGLQNLLEHEYQILQKQVIPTARILLESAEQAGMFSVAGNRSRMVIPPLGATPTVIPTFDPIHVPDDSERKRNGSGGGGGGGIGGGDDQPGRSAEIDGLVAGIEPAFLGLLRRLPAPGTALPKKRRKALIDAFSATVDFIYPDEEPGGH